VTRRGLLLTGALVLTTAPAAAQTNLQLWGNFTTDWAKTPRLTYSLDFEPKVLIARPDDAPGWRAIDVSPSIEYALKNWLDLNAEGDVGQTKQTDHVNSLELTGRLGARFHLFSREKPTILNLRHERPPRRRVVLRDLVRVEFRNFHYSDGTPPASAVRFRNRLEFLEPINKERLTDDGVRYFLADWEIYVPLDDVEERFANRQRIRLGLGHRPSFAWRYQLLYMWTRSRNGIDESFKTTDNIIDFQIKRVF
jgi:hypothetical protein